jgi:hypothetical protein
VVTVNLQTYSGILVTDGNEWYDHEFNGRYEVIKLNALKESDNQPSTHIPYDICPDKPKE